MNSLWSHNIKLRSIDTQAQWHGSSYMYTIIYTLYKMYTNIYINTKHIIIWEYLYDRIHISDTI